MKLFDAIFKVLINQEEKLLLGTDLEIYAIKNEEEPKNPHLYLNFEHNGDRSWAMERHHPTRQQIEEHLTKIILEEETRTQEIANFLNQHLKPEENPLSSGKTIREILKKDHPEIIDTVETHSSSKELKDAAADLIIEVLKEKAQGPKFNQKLGRGDKETYEEFWYEEESDIFRYEEGSTLAYGYPEHEEAFNSEEEFKKFLKKGWIEVKDGIVTGRGNPTGFIPYWLTDMGLGSLREYIEKKKRK